MTSVQDEKDIGILKKENKSLRDEVEKLKQEIKELKGENEKKDSLITFMRWQIQQNNSSPVKSSRRKRSGSLGHLTPQ